MLDAVNVYLRGQAANYVSVGQQVTEGKVTNLKDWEAATKLARDHAANRLEKVLADTWGQAEAIAEDGSFLKPDIVGASTAQVGKTIDVLLVPRPRAPE
jgi:erythromycin esterase-like protein